MIIENTNAVDDYGQTEQLQIVDFFKSNLILNWYERSDEFNRHGLYHISYGWVIKQLFHGCLINSQNNCPSVPRMTMVDYCPRPSASGNSPPWSSSSPRGNSFDYLPNTHVITVN